MEGHPSNRRRPTFLTQIVSASVAVQMMTTNISNNTQSIHYSPTIDPQIQTGLADLVEGTDDLTEKVETYDARQEYGAGTKNTSNQNQNSRPIHARNSENDVFVQGPENPFEILERLRPKIETQRSEGAYTIELLDEIHSAYVQAVNGTGAERITVVDMISGTYTDMFKPNPEDPQDISWIDYKRQYLTEAGEQKLDQHITDMLEIAQDQLMPHQREQVYAISSKLLTNMNAIPFLFPRLLDRSTSDKEKRQLSNLIEDIYINAGKQ